MRWDDLGKLLAVHRHGSVAEAARELGVDASTVSRRLRALEQDLGARLVDRVPEGFVLTDLARRLLPHAEQAEAAANAARALASDADAAPTGLVRVALPDAFAAYFVAPALSELLDAHPGLRVELLASADLVDLSRLEAEIAVRLVRPTHGDLIVQRIASTGWYRGWVHQRYVDVHGMPEGLPEHWLGWGERHLHLPEAQLFQRVVGRPPRARFDDLTTMLHAFRAGVGAVLQPGRMVSAIPGARPTALPEPIDFDLPIWVVTHGSLRSVPRVQVVRDWLVEVTHRITDLT